MKVSFTIYCLLPLSDLMILTAVPPSEKIVYGYTKVIGKLFEMDHVGCTSSLTVVDKGVFINACIKSYRADP